MGVPAWLGRRTQHSSRNVDWCGLPGFSVTPEPRVDRRGVVPVSQRNVIRRVRLRSRRAFVAPLAYDVVALVSVPGRDVGHWQPQCLGDVLPGPTVGELGHDGSV